MIVDINFDTTPLAIFPLIGSQQKKVGGDARVGVGEDKQQKINLHGQRKYRQMRGLRAAPPFIQSGEEGSNPLCPPIIGTWAIGVLDGLKPLCPPPPN